MDFAIIHSHWHRGIETYEEVIGVSITSILMIAQLWNSMRELISSRNSTPLVVITAITREDRRSLDVVERRVSARRNGALPASRNRATDWKTGAEIREVTLEDRKGHFRLESRDKCHMDDPAKQRWTLTD